MKRQVSLRDMALGAVIMLIGLAVGAIVSPSLITQRNNEVFDVITCRGLAVVDENGNLVIALAGSPTGGDLRIMDKDGKTAISLSHSQGIGNAVAVYDMEGHATVTLAGTQAGSMMRVARKENKKAVDVGFDENGGNGITIYDLYENQRVTISSSRLATAINFLDQAGNITWAAP